MHAWEAIQKTVDHIEENLPEKMTPALLAQVAALSPFYFQRLFARLVGRPVSDYIKTRRLAAAAQKLEGSDARIVDIALETGFNSHEDLTRAFQGAYGMTPKEYRQNPVGLNHMIKPELLLHYTLVDEDVPLIVDGMVLEITRKSEGQPRYFRGLRGQVPIAGQIPLGEATGVDVPGQIWERFHEGKAAIPGLVPGGNEVGVALMGEPGSGSFVYFAGAAAEPGAYAENGVSHWEMPAGDYVVCKFEAESADELHTAALDKAMGYLFGTWLRVHKLVSEPFCAELYDSKGEEAAMELWVLPMDGKAGEGE